MGADTSNLCRQIFFSVTGVSIDATPRRYFFFPINGEWQLRIAAFFGDTKPTKNFYGEVESSREMQHSFPKGLKNVKGDGGCLPRTISLAIYGNQRHHLMLRKAVVDFRLKGPMPGETTKRDAKFSKKMEEMRLPKTWMETEEVQAFAFLLDTPIFTCSQIKRMGKSDQYCWQRSPHQSLSPNVWNERGIYILNANDHFQLITNP